MIQRPTTLRIAEPCLESWAAMVPTAAGRHCAACCTEVVDFMRTNRAELIPYSAGPQTQDARFAVPTIYLSQHPKKPKVMRSWVVVRLALTLALPLFKDLEAKPAGFAQLFAPGRLCTPLTNQQEGVEIAGRIQEASSHKNVADATVSLSGTSFSTLSKADGSFRLLVPEEQLKSGFFKLTIVAAGYKSQEAGAAIAAGIPRIDVLLRKKR